LESEQVIHVYASYEGRYWTGQGWIRKEDTSSNISNYESTRYYVVIPATLKVYSHPVANDAYRTVTIQNGERVTVNKYLTRDEAWKYAEGLGWIESTDTLSQVI